MMTLSIPHISLPDDDDDKTFDEGDFDDDAYYAALGTRPPVNMEELDETHQRIIELFSVCAEEDPTGCPSATHTLEASEIDACGHLIPMTAGASSTAHAHIGSVYHDSFT